MGLPVSFLAVASVVETGSTTEVVNSLRLRVSA
jgi:hypothetical protein